MAKSISDSTISTFLPIVILPLLFTVFDILYFPIFYISSDIPYSISAKLPGKHNARLKFVTLNP